jgi:hypothetical protein
MGFLEFAALQRGRCAFSCIHPNAATHGPPTSSAVLVNLGNSSLITSGLLQTELEARPHPALSGNWITNPRRSVMAEMKLTLFFVFAAAVAHAQLAVKVSPVSIIGQKAIVPLALKNNFAEKIESARAVVFLLNEQGKAIGPPTTRWVIGGRHAKPGLAAGATNAFHFVITTARPLETTNLTAKVSFIRVVLAGGKLANVRRDVQIQKAGK